MPSTSPLQIALIRHPNDREVAPYELAIMRAFQGGAEAIGYLAAGGDLGVQVEIFPSAPPISPSTFVNDFSHSLVVLFADQELLEQSPADLWQWVEDYRTIADASSSPHALLVVAMDERCGRRFIRKQKAFENIQLLSVHELGEMAIRATMLALQVIHRCRVMLSKDLFPNNGGAGHLRLFISHAKVDGLPLAHALKHQIDAIPWLQKFYDADDIPSGSNWKKILEEGVGSSLIIILRTEGYDGRHWCQQEVLWADEYATPAVLVEARTGLDHPAAALPFDRIPTVRIPDGNLFRILYLALRESLRYLLFIRRVENLKSLGQIPTPIELCVFCFHPSMSALLRACEVLAASTKPSTTPRWILYPDPTFRTGSFEAAQALVRTLVPSAKLVTPQTIAAGGA